MKNCPWWSGDYSLLELKGQYLKNPNCLHLRFTKQLLSLKNHRKSEHFKECLLKMSRFGLGFTGDPLKLHYRYYPLLWFEDSPCCPFRSQPITASVVKTNGVCRSHQSDLPVYCVMISSWDRLLTRDRVNVLLCTQTHSHVRRIPSTFTGTIYSRVFLLILPAESQQRGRKTHLPVKQYVIVQSHAKFSPQHLFNALKH